MLFNRSPTIGTMFIVFSSSCPNCRSGPVFQDRLIDNLSTEDASPSPINPLESVELLKAHVTITSRTSHGVLLSHWPAHPQPEVTKGPFESSSPSHGSQFSDTDERLVWCKEPWLYKPGIRRNEATCLEPSLFLDYVLPFSASVPYCSSSMIRPNQTTVLLP
jgi:hypothetical protein